MCMYEGQCRESKAYINKIAEQENNATSNELG